MHAGVGVLDPARRRVGLQGRGSLFGLDVVELVSAWRASPCLTPTQPPAPILQILTYPCLNQGDARGGGPLPVGDNHEVKHCPYAPQHRQPMLQHPRIRAAPRPTHSSIQATGPRPDRRLIHDALHRHVLAHVPVHRRGRRSSPRRAAMSSRACPRATAEGGPRHAASPCPPAHAAAEGGSWGTRGGGEEGVAVGGEGREGEPREDVVAGRSGGECRDAIGGGGGRSAEEEGRRGMGRGVGGWGGSN